jgi:hypothetical protein
MIAAVATVWMLLKPAGDAVNDRIGTGGSTSEQDIASTTAQAEIENSTTAAPATLADEETTTSSTTTTTIAQFVNGVRSTAFDPLGDNDEHNEAAFRALDGNAGTFWYTQSYTTRSFGAIKEGVGLIIEFEEPRPVDRLLVSANRVGWAARVYEADGVSPSLEGWGEPIAAFSDLGQSADLDVPDISVTSVLLWITDIGLDPEQTSEDYDAQVAAAETVQRLEISEIELVS